MSIALLTYDGEKHNGHLVQSEAFRCLLCKYTSEVVDDELTALVKNLALRLPATHVSPEKLEKFDIKAIAQCHNRNALFITSVLRSTVGVTNAFDGNNFDEDNTVEEVDLGDEAARQTKKPSRP